MSPTYERSDLGTVTVTVTVATAPVLITAMSSSAPNRVCPGARRSSASVSVPSAPSHSGPTWSAYKFLTIVASHPKPALSGTRSSIAAAVPLAKNVVT